MRGKLYSYISEINITVLGAVYGMRLNKIHGMIMIKPHQKEEKKRALAIQVTEPDEIFLTVRLWISITAISAALTR